MSPMHVSAPDALKLRWHEYPLYGVSENSRAAHPSRTHTSLRTERLGTHAKYVVAIGGDSTVLSALHSVIARPDTAVFAMRLPGSVGALANDFGLTDLDERLKSAEPTSIRPLVADVECLTGNVTAIIGFNEIVVSRVHLQASKLKVRIGNTADLTEMVGDGLIVATPIGSTGYNRSAGGSILQLNSGLLTLTGIAVRRPVDWTNAVLNDGVVIEIGVIDPMFRAVRVEISFHEILGVSRVKISLSPQNPVSLLLERVAGRDRCS